MLLYKSCQVSTWIKTPSCDNQFYKEYLTGSHSMLSHSHQFSQAKIDTTAWHYPKYIHCSDPDVPGGGWVLLNWHWATL